MLPPIQTLQQNITVWLMILRNYKVWSIIWEIFTQFIIFNCVWALPVSSFNCVSTGQHFNSSSLRRFLHSSNEWVVKMNICSNFDRYSLILILNLQGLIFRKNNFAGNRYTSSRSFSRRSFNCCIDAVPPASFNHESRLISIQNLCIKKQKM